MKTFRFSSNLLAATLLALLFTSVASAQAPRTWVSGVGLDTNACSRTAPCKTFAHALTQTVTGGGINCLDAGEFGDGSSLTITQAVTIDCGGTFGSISIGAVTAIIVNAGAGDVVTIRNLLISGGDIGIIYNTGAAVYVENVRMSVTSDHFCIASAGGLLRVDNSTLSDCSTGIVINNVVNSAVVNINNTRITNNTYGIWANQHAVVTVTGSSITDGSSAGIFQASAPSEVFITGSTIASMGTALQSAPGCFIGASGNTFANNGMVYNQNGGQIYTGNDNPLFGNGPLGSTFGAVPKG